MKFSIKDFFSKCDQIRSLECIVSAPYNVFYDLIGVKGSANLFERYMKYIFLDHLIDITSSLLELLNWENTMG